MDGSIDFNDQTSLNAEEVDNKGTDSVLPAEAEPIDLSFAQSLP